MAMLVTCEGANVPAGLLRDVGDIRMDLLKVDILGRLVCGYPGRVAAGRGRW